ncbi:hypothetical protein Tco_0771578 [Tanacetum coccineum]|uniref:Uncharacterized protein n=1 Tax=Tanacetum coccineum TaxID=301880 RepID=A0ABQ4ZIB9_9ASTR
MSTPVYVDPKSSTQADGAQSSRVPVPLLEDPFEAIRQVYLDGTNTEFEPFEDPTDTETPESPLAIAPPIPLSKSTPPISVPFLRRTARMAVRVPLAMSSGLFSSMAEVAAMSESALRKRFWSSCESSPSVSPPDLPLRKRYHGTSKLVEDSEEDDDEEDEEIEDHIDSDSVSEDAEDEGTTAEDEDPDAEDEDLTARVKSPCIDDEGYGLDDEGHGRDDESHGIEYEGHSVKSNRLGLEEEGEAIPRGQQQVAPVMETTVSAPLGLGYGALRHRELELEESNIYSTFEVGQGFGSAPVSERPERVSAFRQPTLTTWIDPEERGLISDHAVRLEELSPSLFKRYDRDIGELFPRSGAVREEIFSQRYRFRSLEYEHERVAVTFRAIWRPVLALEAWAGENRDLRLQLAEERHARLELADVVDGRRRGQEPRGDLKDIAGLIETGAHSREVRWISRAVRLTTAFNRKLKAYVVSLFLSFALTPGTEAHSRLVAYLLKRYNRVRDVKLLRFKGEE